MKLPESLKPRHRQMLQLLDEHGELDVATLADHLQASEATIRRDLNSLQDKELLTRTFGGAILRERQSLVMQTFDEKRERNRQAKERIAARAATLVEPGMSLILDTGTSTWRLAALLKAKAPLTIFTTALAVVEELGTVPGITLHVMGGLFRRENLDFVGPHTQTALRGIYADMAFISCDGFIADRGAFCHDEVSAALGNAMAESARQRVLIADHSKFDTPGNYLALPCAQINYIITDSGLSDARRTQLSSYPDLKLLIAD